MRNSLYTFCLGIGLNMFFPELFVVVPAPLSPKAVFFKPKGRRKKGGVHPGYHTAHLHRTQNK